jgi:hypothetical protein
MFEIAILRKVRGRDPMDVVKDSGSDLKIEKRVSSIKKLAYSNAEWGLRFRLRPRGASAPEGEPSGSERLRN